MKQCESKVRKKMIVVRLNEVEYETLQKLKEKSLERSLSNYIRKILLQKPVTVKYRNASADDFLREMIDLKNGLSALGNNYNQAVKKLHVLQKIPEFRTWILIYEKSRTDFLQKVESINTKVGQLYEQWLQK